MKRNEAMKTLGKSLAGLLLAGLCLGAALFLSCENPLRAGLGPQVDIKDPTVELVSPKPGDYLYNEVVFEGTAWDDIALAGVWMRLGESETWIQASLDKASGQWSCSYDTNLFIDGDLKVRLKVQDQYGRSVETADLAYVVKNGKPGVKITIPLIETYTAANAPSEFNKGNAGPVPPDDGFEKSRIQDAGGSLMGTVTDLRGIQRGGVKIKFWPVDEYPGEGTIPPDEPGATGYDPRYTWQDPVISEEDQQAGMTTVDFSFPYTIQNIGPDNKPVNTEAPLAANKYYRFQIKAVDMFDNVFIYPPELYAQPETDNKYVEIYIRSPDEEPKIALHAKTLKDGGALTSYDDRTDNPADPWKIPQLIPRTYMEGRSSFFYENFAVQIMTSHSEGIGAAEYQIANEQGALTGWEKDWDSGYNGLEETDDRTFNPPGYATGIKTIKYYRKTFGTLDGVSGRFLPEGKYTITIRASSASGSQVSQAYDFYIDKTVPAVSLDGIQGALSTGEKAYTINNIVSPTVRISDGTGSRIRAVDPVDSAASTVAYGPREQKWFIAGSAAKAIIDGLAADPFWYPGNNYADSGASDYAGFGVLQHKWLEGNTFKIQANELGLSNGGVYYLYIFARDNSFNVSHECYELKVDDSSDKPVYTFGYDEGRNALGADAVGLIDPGVDDPNSAAVSGGFSAGGAIRNRLSNTDTIKFKISDDDGLDLGYNSGLSGLKVYITGTYVDSGNIKPLTDLDAGYRKALSDADVKKAFQPNGGEKYVTARTGEILQDYLKAALLTGTEYTSGSHKLPDSSVGLPDGIYRLEIAAFDLTAAKITGTGETLGSIVSGGEYSSASLSGYAGNPDSRAESFYFVVDTKNPEVTIDSHSDRNYASAANTFRGTISDTNGPLTDASGGDNEAGQPDKLTVTAAKKSRDAADFSPATVGDSGSDVTVAFSPFTPIADPLLFKSEWEASVTLNSSMNSFSGEIRLTFSGKDRFGRVGSRTVTLIVDNSPPELRLSSVPRTVKRGAVQNYVNQYIEFTFGIRDDYPIDGVRWGIIAQAEFDSSIKDIISQAGLAAAYEDMTAASSDAAHAYGELDVAGAVYTVRYNTAGLPDGEHVLYAIAKDRAGNYSPLDGGTAGGSADTRLPFSMNINQATDKPSFEVYRSAFKPADGSVVGRSDLVVEGRITDDDGFNLDGNGPEPPVKIKYGYNDGTDKETAWITLPPGKVGPDNAPRVNLEANGTTDVVFLLNLPSLVSGDPGFAELSAIGIGPDKIQWIKIQAHDSPSRKYQPDETAQAEDAITLTFTLDTLPPVVALTLLGTPPNPVFGKGNEDSFGLHVKVTEANLNTDSGTGKGIVKYQLSGPEGEAGEYPVDTANNTGDVWEFDLPNAKSLFYKDPDGVYVITVTATDRSGKTGLGVLSFTKDVTGPATLISGLSPSPSRLPLGSPDLTHDWFVDTGSFTPPNDPAQVESWRAEQAEWLSENDVPVVAYKETPPNLKGTFTDDFSPVKLSSTSTEEFQYRFDGKLSWEPAINLEGQGKTANWTIPLDGQSLEDGVHSVSLKVADTTGNENTDDQDNWYVFRLDHRVPLLTVDNAPDRSFSGGFTLSGHAEDANLKTVKLIFKDVDGIAARTIDLADTADPFAALVTKRVWTSRSALSPGGSVFTWEYTIDAALFNLLGKGNNTDGGCTVEVRAVDYSGSEDAVVEWKFIRDGTGPSVAPDGFSAAADTDENPWNAAANMKKFTETNPQIPGSAEDADRRTALGSLETYLEYWDYSESAANKWKQKEDWSAVTNSGGAPLVTAANTSAALSFTKYLGSTSAVPNASNLDDGIYRIKFRAGDQAEPPNETGNGGWYVFIIDRSQPVISTNPAAYTDPLSNNEQVTGASHQMTFKGAVRDRNEITGVKARFINYNPGVSADALLDSGTYDAGTGFWTYNWEVKLTAQHDPAISKADYTLEITAQDKGQPGPVVLTRSFSLDNAPPSGRVEVPPAISGNTSAEVTERTSLTGTVAEPNGVSFLGFTMRPESLSDTEAEALADGDFTRAGESWQPASIGVDEDTDLSGWTGNLVEFLNAIYDWTLNIADIGVLTAPFIRDGQAYNYSNTSGDPNYDAVHGPNSTLIAKPVEGEVGIYQINFLFRVRDRAGNTSHFNRVVKVNPRGNIPTVSIENPVHVGQSDSPRGGTISANGGATDNQSVYAVIFRVIQYDNAGTAPDKAVYMNEYLESADGLADWADALIPASGEEANPYPAIVVGGGDTRQGWMLASIGTPDKNVTWTSRINSGGEIDTTVKRRVMIEVRSVDWNPTLSGPGQVSAPELREIWVTSGAPEIDAVKVNGKEVITSPPVRGDYIITAEVKDTGASSITDIRWEGQAKGDTAETWHDITGVTNSGSNIGYVSGSGTAYTVSIPIESKKVLAGAYDKSAGTYTITLRATNQLGYSAEQSITVSIDNFTPFRDDHAYANEKAAGTDYYVVGKVWDYDQAASAPEVRSLDKVVAWFTRGAAYEYLKEGTGPGSITTGSVTAVSGRTGPAVDGTSGSVTYPAAQGYYVTLGPDSEYASDSNGDGYFPTNFTGTDSGLREWSFKLDTTLLADGVLTLHYLVYDAAGNVSYYTQEITIMNNPPAIDEVVLVTDPLGLSRLDFEPLDEAERHKVIRENWHDTGFKVWSNQLAFRVKTLDGRGNGRMHYRIFPATRVEAETSALVVGDIYTIKSLGTGVPWDDLGAPSLRSDDGGTHFMAKAATTADTSGKVWKYVVPHESLKKTTDGPAASGQYHDAVSFTYSGADFGSGKINPAAADNLYWFIIKVWDSVHPSNAEADQLSDFVVVGLDVLGPEAVKPAIQLYDPNPYTETTVIDNNATPEAKAATLDEALDPVSSARNRERGGLYNTGTSTELRRSGHIDPKNGTTAALTAADKPASPYTSSANYAVDKISGKVILRGSASDNRRIDKINLKIGAAAAVTVFERVDGVLAAKSPYSGKIVETMNWSTGNQVEWALLWDSETLRDTDNAVIKSNLAVELIAADSSANANTQTTAADNHSKITVDLVPYITGFKRDGTKLSSRSKQGWFSFDRGESNITVEGFNLTNAKSGVSLSVGGVAATVNYTTEETAPPYTVKVNLAATAAPGVIAYTPAPLNAGNDDSKSWNSFYHPNTSGSKLWQDNLNAHIWVSDHAVTLGSDRTYMGQDNSANTSEEAEYVGMAMGTGNKLYGSFSVYATTGVYIADNQNGARISLQHGAYEPSRETDISVAASSGDRSVVYNYVRDYDTAQQSGINYSSSGTGTRVEYAYYNAGRFMNPRITYNNGSTYRYITYYDAHTKQLRYARNATPVSLDGADVSADTAHINGVNGTPDPAHSSDAGLWSAVDYLSDNYPIVAYYDAANTTLRLMYAYQSDNPGALNTAGTTWRRQYVMDSGDAYYAKSGEYVSMKVQRVSAPTGTAAAHVYTDIIHLAFYNAEYKTVVYAKGTWNNTNKKWDFTTTAVDNHIKSVAWTDISLDNGKNPWITYGDGNRLGNYDGAKIAYLNSTQFNRTSTDENDSAKGNTGWEAMYVPSRYIVKNGRINIEAYPAASPPNWIAAVGYQSDRFRIAYMIKE